MAEAVVTIVNKKGLHARAAAKFVKSVAAHKARIEVSKLDGAAESPPVPGGSILGLMMLGADPGSQLRISAEGEGAQAALAALVSLVEDKFGEGE